MARVAQWRDDISGAIITGGTSTAYTVSSNQVFDTFAHMDGAMIAFTPHATNTSGGGTTLNVDGLGARALRVSPGVELVDGHLILGTPYVVTYSNADSAFYLQGGAANAYAIPLAGGIDYWGSTAPNSAFAFPAGQAISRTTYATLYALVGNTYGAGDGSATFNLPDKRGRISAAKDNMNGSAANRLTSTYFGAATGGAAGTALGAVGGSESWTLTQAQMPQHQHTGNTGANDVDHTHGVPQAGNSTTGGISPGGGTGGVVNSTVQSSGQSSQHSHPFTTNITGGGGAHPTVPPSIICNYIMRII